MTFIHSRYLSRDVPVAAMLLRCVLAAALAVLWEPVFAAPPWAKAVLGIQTKSSWKGSPEAFAAEFFKRGLPPASGHGWFVDAVNPESAGAIKVNDIITSIDGITIRSDAAVDRVYKKLKAGRECNIELRRVAENGKSWKTVKVTAKPIDREVADKYWEEVEAKQPAGEQQSPAVE